MTEPRIEERGEQPYVAIKESVTLETIGQVLPPLVGEVFGWLDAHQVAPAGDVFWKYDVIDMEREMVVEVGIPVAAPVPGDERVRPGVLPAGRYATVTHVGPYGRHLMEATARLLDWGKDQGLTWDMSQAGAGELWGARLEFYRNDPNEVPEDKLETVLAFRLAD